MPERLNRRRLTETAARLCSTAACSSPRIHCDLDPSSGAVLCYARVARTAGRAGDRIAGCSQTTGILDSERETTLDEVLATLELPCQRFQAELATGNPAEVVDLTVNGVRVTVMPTASSRAERRVCGQPGVDAAGRGSAGLPSSATCSGTGRL